MNQSSQTHSFPISAIEDMVIVSTSDSGKVVISVRDADGDKGVIWGREISATRAGQISEALYRASHFSKIPGKRGVA